MDQDPESRYCINNMQMKWNEKEIKEWIPLEKLLWKREILRYDAALEAHNCLQAIFFSLLCLPAIDCPLTLNEWNYYPFYIGVVGDKGNWERVKSGRVKEVGEWGTFDGFWRSYQPDTSWACLCCPTFFFFLNIVNFGMDIYLLTKISGATILPFSSPLFIFTYPISPLLKHFFFFCQISK